MIFGDIQQYGHVGTETVDGVELETAHLCHDNLGFLLAINIADKGLADVAANEHLQSGMRQHFSNQCCRCCFAIGAGDGHDRFLNEAGGQLHFAPYGNALRPGICKGC